MKAAWKQKVNSWPASSQLIYSRNFKRQQQIFLYLSEAGEGQVSWMWEQMVDYNTIFPVSAEKLHFTPVTKPFWLNIENTSTESL
jgi:hypothetical protein